MRGEKQTLALPAEENNGDKKEEARRAVEVINASAQPGRREEKANSQDIVCSVCVCV